MDQQPITPGTAEWTTHPVFALPTRPGHSKQVHLTATAQDSPGPQTVDTAKAFHEGFLCGAAAYAREIGDSSLKSQNHILAKIMDEQGWRTIERFEQITAAGGTLV